MRSTARLSNGVMRLSDERPPLNKRAFFRSPRRCAFCCSTGFVRLAVPRSGLRASLSRSACSYTHRSDRAWACAICRSDRARDPFRIRIWQLFSFSWRLSAFRKIGMAKCLVISLLPKTCRPTIRLAGAFWPENRPQTPRFRPENEKSGEMSAKCGC